MLGQLFHSVPIFSICLFHHFSFLFLTSALKVSAAIPGFMPIAKAERREERVVLVIALKKKKC